MTEAHLDQNILVEIITPEFALYSRAVYMVVIPGSQGEFGVLPGHVAMVAAIKPGLITTYDIKMKVLDRIFIAGGFAEVTKNSVNVLVEKAAYLSDYNLETVTKDLNKLKDSLDLCDLDNEKDLIQKDIQFTEVLLANIKNLKDNAIK